MSELDDAAAALNAAGDNDMARLRFYERLADTELFLALEAEPAPGAETISPRIFEVEDARFALVFDRAGRLTEFAEGPAPYVAMSGRTVAEMLAGQGIGLAVNPGVAPSSMLVEPEVLDWLHDRLSAAPGEETAQLVGLAPPPELPETVLTGLDRKLAMATGRARHAWLVEADYDSGARGALLVFIDPAPGAEGALAQIVQEALVFSGLEAGAIDVGFAPAASPLAARLAKVGLRFDLPEPAQEDTRPAPGSDPDKPPILR